MCLLRVYWRIRHGKLPPWEKDCEIHDAYYFPGGTAADKLDADINLMRAIASYGYIILSVLVFIGVRIGGVWWLWLPWRWGFGWKSLRKYQPREETGLAFLEEMHLIRYRK